MWKLQIKKNCITLKAKRDKNEKDLMLHNTPRREQYPTLRIVFMIDVIL